MIEQYQQLIKQRPIIDPQTSDLDPSHRILMINYRDNEITLLKRLIALIEDEKTLLLNANIWFKVKK